MAEPSTERLPMPMDDQEKAVLSILKDLYQGKEGRTHAHVNATGPNVASLSTDKQCSADDRHPTYSQTPPPASGLPDLIGWRECGHQVSVLLRFHNDHHCVQNVLRQRESTHQSHSSNI